MKRSKIFPSLLILTTVLFVNIVQAAGTGKSPSANWQAEFVEYVQNSLEEDHIPGVAIALVNSDGIILTKGFGVRNIQTNAPVTAQTLFHIGSTQKSMTAMMIAVLVDEGQLDWDTPIVNYVPSFSLSDAEAQNDITMRHLLSMRGGIPANAEDDLPERASVADVFRVVAQSRLLGRPGQRFSYSNLSASVAGYLGVLAWGGNSNDLYEGYAQLLQRKILDPIGMSSATIKRSVALRNPNYALSYILNGRGQPQLSDSYDFDGDALAPSGSLKASAHDMGLYIATHLNNGVAPNGRRVVSAKQLHATYRPYLENYGMGWEVDRYRGTQIIKHTGSFDDFASVIGFIPEFDVGFVVLVNSEEAGDNIIEDAAYELVELLSE